MEFLFWPGLGMLIGYAAAQRRGFAVAGGVLGGLLLGPLAFLLFFVSGISGNDARRRCPHCAEWIRPEALVCPQCRRDVPVEEKAQTPPPARLGRIVLWSVPVAFASLLAFVLLQPTPSSGPATSSGPRVATDTPLATWRDIGHWQGTGIKETESFTVTTREWRVAWKTSAEAFPGAGIFQIYVHNADTGELVTLAANIQGVGADTSYVRSAPGRYYLQVNSGNVSWDVTAQGPQ